MQLAASRVTVTDVAGSPALLEIRRTAADPPPESLGDVQWRLEYGDLTLASGTLSRLAHGVVVPVRYGGDELDWACLRLVAPVEDGAGPAIEGKVIRAPSPVTRAEAVARSRWPGVRRQRVAPLTAVAPVGRWALTTPGLADREADEGADDVVGGAASSSMARRVDGAVVYGSAAELVEQRRASLRAPRPAGRGGERP